MHITTRHTRQECLSYVLASQCATCQTDMVVFQLLIRNRNYRRIGGLAADGDDYGVIPPRRLPSPECCTDLCSCWSSASFAASGSRSLTQGFRPQIGFLCVSAPRR